MEDRPIPRPDESDVDHVTDSAARERVLRSLRDRPAASKSLCEHLPGSESGIYAATADLADRGLIERIDGKRWRLTGRGTVVVNAIARQRRLEAALATDPDYWNEHDVTALPAPFRERLHVLADCRIARSTAADPQRVVRRIRDRVADAERVRVVSPVYSADYEAALLAAAERGEQRVVLDPSVVAGVDETATDADARIDVRVLDVDVAVGIVDGALLLSLPTRRGEYDLRTDLLATEPEAVEWGERLFAHYWERATPLAAHPAADG